MMIRRRRTGRGGEDGNIFRHRCLLEKRVGSSRDFGKWDMLVRPRL